MTVDALAALVGILVALNAVLIRMLWRFGNRLARLEGRLNGDRRQRS